MPDDAAAYLLLAVDLLVVAVVLTLPLLALLWLIGKPRKVRRTRRVLRRCEACGVAWKGVPGHDLGRTSLRIRRWKRRRSRARKQDTPAWAGRQGWSRCPSCLSTKVRTSSRDGHESRESAAH